MSALIIVLAIAAATLIAFDRRIGRRGFLVASAALATTFVLLAATSPSVLSGSVRTEAFDWVPDLGLGLDFRLDGFGLFMALIVTGIGAVVLAYSLSYFRRADGSDARPDLGRLSGLLLAFAASMLGLVLADGFFTLFLFWELTSITSFFLIGIDDRSNAARTAAQRALLVTGAGGLALLAGLVLLGQQSDTTTISALVQVPPEGTVVTVALMLVLLGAATKSAQFPFHFWLPGAMAAPTPVSAYLHSATMVKAGIVLVARLAPAFAPVGPWRILVLIGGGGALLLGGWRALREHDAKLVLAYGTVSQLGLIMLLVGLGTAKATYAGVAMILAHALFKAALFLAVGIVDHQAHTRDLRRLGGLGRSLPALAVVAAIAIASMAAIPPTFGFLAKESGLQSLLDAGLGATTSVALLVTVAGSVLTVAYSIRLFDGIFLRGVPNRAGPTRIPPVDPTRVRSAGALLVAGPAVLAAGSLILGLAPNAIGAVLGDVASALDPASGKYTLKLWPGLVPALGLSALTWAGGAAVAALVHRREDGRDPRPATATRVYSRVYDGLLDGSRRITAIVQSGSLPVYLAIVLTSIVGGLLAAVGSGFTISGIPVAESPLQVVLVVATGLLVLGIPSARRRFTAALLLGGAGYGLALVFLAYGAPDVAMTQFLVETTVVVMFLLVLRQLPDRFTSAPTWAPSMARVGLSVAVGITVTVFALGVSSARVDRSVGRDYLERAVDEGGGRNVVNVILVDFRALDTVGEITVLLVAVIGVVNLAGAARRAQARRRNTGGPEVTDPPTPGGDPHGRSVVLSTTARGLAPVLAVLALWLLGRGHNAPGGGFVAGLVLAAAVVLAYLAEGRRTLRWQRIRPLTIAGTGLGLVAVVSTAPLLVGRPFLDAAIWKPELPLIGAVKLVSSSVLDVGVMLVVAGVVLAAVTAFARDPDDAEVSA